MGVGVGVGVEGVGGGGGVEGGGASNTLPQLLTGERKNFAPGHGRIR